MGSWDVGSFENDGALDFVDYFIEENDLQRLHETFDAIFADGAYVEVDFGEAGIAAAEVVALLCGKPAKSLPDDLISWHRANESLVADDALAGKAVRALQRINAPDSELRELWEESDEFAEWTRNVDDIIARLQS